MKKFKTLLFFGVSLSHMIFGSCCGKKTLLVREKVYLMPLQISNPIEDINISSSSLPTVSSSSTGTEKTASNVQVNAISLALILNKDQNLEEIQKKKLRLKKIRELFESRGYIYDEKIVNQIAQLCGSNDLLKVSDDQFEQNFDRARVIYRNYLFDSRVSVSQCLSNIKQVIDDGIDLEQLKESVSKVMEWEPPISHDVLNCQMHLHDVDMIKNGHDWRLNSVSDDILYKLRHYPKKEFYMRLRRKGYDFLSSEIENKSNFGSAISPQTLNGLFEKCIGLQ